MLLAHGVLATVLRTTGDYRAPIDGLRGSLLGALLQQSHLLLVLLHQPILIAQLLEHIVLLWRQIGLVLLEMLQELHLLLVQVLWRWRNGGSAIGLLLLLLQLVLGSFLGGLETFVGNDTILGGSCLLGVRIGRRWTLRGLKLNKKVKIRLFEAIEAI